jgi:hypothetical protein
MSCPFGELWDTVGDLVFVPILLGGGSQDATQFEELNGRNVLPPILQCLTTTTTKPIMRQMNEVSYFARVHGY